MKKAFYAVFAAIVVALSACGGQAHAAASNNFTKNDKIYTVADARMITVTSSTFQITYSDGNVSDVYADPGLVTWNALKIGAPALKNIVEVQAGSGVFINPDFRQFLQCQVGTGAAGTPTTNGDHIYIRWARTGYSVLPDTGCATYWTIRNSGN